MQIKENVPLAPLTTFGIGGVARYLALAQDIKEIVAAFAYAKEKDLKVLLLGGGSNMLMPDTGWSGLVIKIEVKGVEIETNVVIAGAGEGWDGVVAQAVSKELWGLENLSGIPGTVGGAVVQNIGAYGAALSQTLSWVEVFDTTSGEVKKLTNAECAFGYRTSIFKKNAGRYIVLRAAFELSTAPNPNLAYRDPNKAYKDIAQILEKNPEPSLADLRAAVLAIRADKFPDISVEGTAGSFFLNPIVPEEAARGLEERFPGMPLFAMPETTDMKVPLGWILDHVLHMRGFTLGKVRLFEKQALVVVAERGATASDVQALVQKIKKEVKEKLDLEIEEEVKVIL